MYKGKAFNKCLSQKQKHVIIILVESIEHSKQCVTVVSVVCTDKYVVNPTTK